MISDIVNIYVSIKLKYIQKLSIDRKIYPYINIYIYIYMCVCVCVCACVCVCVCVCVCMCMYDKVHELLYNV